MPDNKRKLSPEQVRLIRQNFEKPKRERLLLRELAEQLGVAINTVAMVKEGRTYRDIPD